LNKKIIFLLEYPLQACSSW